MKAIHRLYRDQRGMSFVFIGLGFMGFLCATTLAIDVGMFMTARTQAQTSADAGALAGATALAFNSFTDHSSTGPAVTGAINTARANLVVGQQVSVTPNDVTFPNDPATGQSDLVQVNVYRTAARGNPLSTMMGGFFGITQADVQATATASATSANADTCLLPFTIPDKWIEKQCATETCPWSPTDTFDMYDNKGNLIPNPDVYVPPTSTTNPPTGYNAVADRGLQLVLKASNGTNISPSWYNPWDISGITGASAYSANISGCNSATLKITDWMLPETGNMVGPTQSGVTGLINADPNAYWDTSCQCVKGSAFPLSPRIRPIPLYDPTVFAQGKATGKSGPQLQTVNFLGVFIESVTGGGDVTARVTPALGKIVIGGPVVIGGFAQAIMLVK